eukprot:3625648-Rhodomonas_salina.3
MLFDGGVESEDADEIDLGSASGWTRRSGARVAGARAISSLSQPAPARSRAVAELFDDFGHDLESVLEIREEPELVLRVVAAPDHA